MHFWPLNSGPWSHKTRWSLKSGPIYKKNYWCIQIVVLQERWSLNSGVSDNWFYCTNLISEHSLPYLNQIHLSSSLHNSTSFAEITKMWGNNPILTWCLNIPLYISAKYTWLEFLPSQLNLFAEAIKMRSNNPILIWYLNIPLHLSTK